jgi:3-oxoacyl-[acyl-carrier-protein] synthase-3
MDAGGYRYPSSLSTLVMRTVDEEGNQRSLEHGYMDGGEVFNVVLQKVPKSIKQLLLRSGISMEDVSFVVLHQANKFMNDHLVKKMKMNPNKVLSNVNRFGNTSSVSIPLAIATELPKQKMLNDGFSLLSGFGVGMSWANALIKLEHTAIIELVEC